MLPLMHLEHISQLRAERFFIVEWEICSNYCNPIVKKISRALSTFSLQKLIVVRKSRILMHTAVSQPRLPLLVPATAPQQRLRAQLEPLLAISRANKGRSRVPDGQTDLEEHRHCLIRRGTLPTGKHFQGGCNIALITS